MKEKGGELSVVQRVGAASATALLGVGLTYLFVDGSAAEQYKAMQWCLDANEHVEDAVQQCMDTMDADRVSAAVGQEGACPTTCFRPVAEPVESSAENDDTKPYWILAETVILGSSVLLWGRYTQR
jgi:hypothetical protein